MKKINYYTFIICTFVVAALSISIITITKESMKITKESKSVDNNNLSKFLQSSILETASSVKEIEIESSKQTEVEVKKETESDNKKESTEVNGTKQEEVKKEKIEEKQPEKKQEEQPKQPVQEPEEVTPKDNYSAIETNGHNVLETYTGTISYYGPDCSGCSGRTASGYNISKTSTTYPDNTYGNIRIVAGDYKYPFGTIVRFTYQNGQTELAIVLDRGGVGIGKKYQFDLLVASEQDSYKKGISPNTKIEILRSGY